MADYAPAVHRDLIRNALPGPNGRKMANVADDEIDSYITAATRKVLREAGVPQNPEDQAEAEYIISMYAKADTLERALSEQVVAEVPLATSWRTRADTQLESFDITTTGGEEAVEHAAKAANVKNLAIDDIDMFGPADFGISSSGGVGTSPRSTDIWP